MKIVGRRQAKHDWSDIERLQTTADALRGHDAVVPRGVYRFSTFEEADAWMTRLAARPHVRRGRKTSPASAKR